MNGFFIGKKTISWLVLLLLCGAFFIGLYIFLNIVDPAANSELLVFLCAGILLCIIAIPSILSTRSTYIRIEKDSIHARYRWFGKIDCNMEEVAFAMAQANTLTILLKNGKRHVIMGVENALSLALYICRELFVVETEAPDTLLFKLKAEQTAQKNKVFLCLGGVVLMFVNIFVAAILTGGRELYEFSNIDWILFAVMGLIEAATVIITFYFAGQCSKHLIPIAHLKYRLRGAIILSQPLPLGNPIRVYTAESHVGRIILFGFPNGKSVYCCVQEFNADNVLDTVYTSEIYEDEKHIPADFEALIDITEAILR